MNFFDKLRGINRVLRGPSGNQTRPVRPKRIPPLVIHWQIQDVGAPCECELCQANRAMNGAAVTPFNVSQYLTQLTSDVISRSEHFRQINLAKLLLTVTYARNRRAAGLQAKVTPMRFMNGESKTLRRGKEYQVQKYMVGGEEMLYLMTFCIPRFLDLPFEEKLITLFHELYHISPEFNGDLRRHPGRYTYHTSNQKCYDQQMEVMVKEYLATNPDPQLLEPLTHNFDSLHQQHGGVVGLQIPIPKLIPTASM